ncbi:uncharacterized protein LOC135829160 [Sycon ciliatum]|uniref:uncharacterized protein LOC135829160 n=1 Tax=Sycon ciliatum TaxID=27933 RepID=UPI0031F68882
MSARSLTTSSATSCSSRRSLRSIDELDAEAERIAAEELAEVERKLIRKKLELQKKLNRNRSSGSSNASVRSSSSRRSRETGNGSELTCADRISLAERAQRAERAERNMGAALEEANGQIQDLLLDHQVQGEQASGNEPNGTRPTPTSARQSHPMNLTTHHFMARQSTAKDLPQFSGHADEWPAFIFALEHTTRECGFSNGENLGRLQKALRGKAKEAVQGMMTLPDNVGEVISILRMRFGRPDQIVQNLILKTKSQKGMKSEEAIEVLIEISALCRNLVATMRSTKCTGHLYNPQLVKELVGKLSGGLRIQWGEYVLKTGTDPHLDTFSAWLQQRAKAACLVAQPSPCDVTQATLRTGQTFTVVEATAGKPHCLFCSKAGHTTSSCRQLAAEPLNARRQFVSDRRLCFRCLGEGHLARVCEEKACSCGKPHHPLLHRDGRGSVAPLGRMSETTYTSATHVSEHSGRVLLRVIPVTVRNGDTAADTYALLDEGSTVSLIESELAEELGLAGPTRPLRLSWTDGKQHQESSSKVVTFSVAGRQRQDSFTLTNVHTHAKFNLPTQSINPQRLKNCPHLEGLELPTLSCAKPRLLIGQDNYSLIAPRVIAEGPPNAPVATQTKLGWVVHGKTIADRCRIDEGVVLSTWGLDSDLHDLVQQSFALDSLGVKPAKIRSKADDRALQLLDTLTTRTGRRWQTGLLWREDNITLPRSKATAAQRLEQLERRLRKDDTLAQGYQSKIDSYLEQGYARKLSPEEATHQPERTWYLPHFAVYNKEKGKVRLVFDAAAKSHGKSLNDFLLTGPDLLTPITQVLYNFRLYEVAFGADIKEMFHQVKMRPEDRHAQRFLWRDMDASRPADVYQMDVMTFGAVCSPTAGQFAKNINAHDLASGDARTVTAIEECHYVDDYFDSTPTTEEAVALTRKVMDVHEGGGFVIRNWVSNSPTVLESLPSDLRSPRIVNVHSHDLPIEKTLGLRWDPAKDTLGFSCGTKPDPKAPVTKRSVLRHTMSVFDPLGLVSCHSIIAHMLLQDVWRAGIGWDDELPASLALRWTDWAAELDQVATVEVPRCYTPLIAVATDIQLHVFADASEKAYGAAAYLRVANHGTQLAVSLVAAKARVAPLKPASIPRLELQAAVLASRLSCTVREQLRISIPRVIFWTDSRTVLLWIRSDARQFKPFVAHRIAEITDTTEVDQWHWVPTRLNPADDLSRGISAQRLQPDDRWFGGPDYLRQGEADWPAEETRTPDPDDLELKRAFSGVHAAAGDSSEPPSLKAALPEIERFSSWCRLVRATAWVLRFTRHLRHGGRDTAKPSLTVPELRAAESLWWKAAQAEGFPEELAALRNGKPVNKDSRLVQMTPFIDDNGIMRSDSRVRNAKVENKNLRQPVLLPPKHAFTRLLIQQHHVWSLHQGQDRVVNELRQKYWVPGIRTAVRSTWSECQHCKNLRAKPQPPIMSALPECRTDAFQRPFTRTGLDYFGPLSVTVGRRHEKRYGALFTCLATRAVHVELAHDLSTDSTLMAIRRFISRRGCPLVIHSDNGTNFKGAAKELRQAIRELNEARIQDQLSHDGITWSFNPPAAPHMGGAWERLVGSIKTALHAILKERHPKEETLLTALAEAEALVNSRPLTHVSLDAADDEALTPNHFLIGSSCAILQGIAQAGDVSLRRQWRVAQALADMFWRRWVREYLPTLARRTKWNRQTKQLVVNDIVIIADDNAPRGSWPKGVVSAVHPGRDGVVRVVDVKTASGSVFRRPAAKICVLDVRS